MKNKRLAQWLQDHTEMLGSIPNEKDQAFHIALYEGLIDMAAEGETRMVDSVVESAAAHAVAIGRELTDLLSVPERLRARTWQRIGEEIDPEPAFTMLSALDGMFVHIIKTTIDTYLETTKLAHAAKSVEISRLYSESEQKVMRYAAEVARANRELARLEQAKTDFISIAAHELKTPLTLIQGYVNILNDLLNEEQPKRLAEGIQRGAERMNNIIEDMLDLSSIDMKQLGLVLQKVNLKKSIDLVIAQLQHALIERRQTIKTENLEPLPLIEGDARRLHQVFRQILSNAIKYTPDGGQISVTGQELSTLSDGAGYVQVTIQDTGVGIAPEDREKIFEKFYRSSSSTLHSTGQTKFMGAGPGLGLAIVKGLIEAHGGRVAVDSPGFDMQNCPGSSFHVALPIQANPQPGVHIQWMESQPHKEAEETSLQPNPVKEQEEMSL
jgi:signal transduction histidine kinase